MDRKAISQALNKSLAYKATGNQHAANEWAMKLIQLLKKEGISCG